MDRKTNSKKYLEEKFPALSDYKKCTSRMYEKADKPGYRDNWWFHFTDDDLDGSEFIVFAGALDYENKEFRVLKVPSSYIKSNINKIDMNSKGWINLYVHFTELVDLRNKSHLSFKGFELN